LCDTHVETPNAEKKKPLGFVLLRNSQGVRRFLSVKERFNALVLPMCYEKSNDFLLDRKKPFPSPKVVSKQELLSDRENENATKN
jgi:hypothetical protein